MKSPIKIAAQALTAFLFVISMTTTLFAEDSLKAPLIDIPGWQAEKAEGMDMNMNGVKMMNAIRSYEKDSSTFDVAIMVTTLQMGLAPFQQMNMSQGGVKIATTQMDNFKVMQTNDSNDKSGTIMILLGETKTNSAIFSLSYEGITEEEGLALAKQFNWGQIQTAAKALMN